MARDSYSRADTGMTIKVEGTFLVYRKERSHYSEARTTNYLILGVRPNYPRSESTLMDDSGVQWQTGVAYVSMPGDKFGDASSRGERLVAWQWGEKDYREAEPLYMMEIQYRENGGDWVQVRKNLGLRPVSTNVPWFGSAMGYLGQYREPEWTRPGREYRGIVRQYVGDRQGRVAWVTLDGAVTVEN